MTTCLTRRKLSTGNVVVPYKVGEAGHARDAMTKTLYALLFEWIIKQINKTLEVSFVYNCSVVAFFSCSLVDVGGLRAQVKGSYSWLPFYLPRLEHNMILGRSFTREVAVMFSQFRG